MFVHPTLRGHTLQQQEPGNRLLPVLMLQIQGNFIRLCRVIIKKIRICLSGSISHINLISLDIKITNAISSRKTETETFSEKHHL